MSSNSKVVQIANLIGGHNYITFDEIEKSTGLTASDVLNLKTLLEEYMTVKEGTRIFISSRTDLDPPGLFIDD